MTDWPCIADTDSVALSIDGDRLVATAIIDPDPTNAMYVRADGLAVPYGTGQSACICRPSAENIATASTPTWNTVKWDTGGVSGPGTIAVLPVLVSNAAGLWAVGATVGFNTAAAVGQVQMTVVGTLGGVSTNIAVDSQTSTAVFSGNTTETLQLNAMGYIECSVGMTFTVSIAHNFGGTIPLLPSSQPAGGAVAGAAESGGANFWATLVRPY